MIRKCGNNKLSRINVFLYVKLVPLSLRNYSTNCKQIWEVCHIEPILGFEQAYARPV